VNGHELDLGVECRPIGFGTLELARHMRVTVASRPRQNSYAHIGPGEIDSTTTLAQPVFSSSDTILPHVPTPASQSCSTTILVLLMSWFMRHVEPSPDHEHSAPPKRNPRRIPCLVLYQSCLNLRYPSPCLTSSHHELTPSVPFLH
jgi:hypothetical protein